MPWTPWSQASCHETLFHTVSRCGSGGSPTAEAELSPASQSSWKGAEQIEREFEGCFQSAVALHRGDFDRLCSEWFVVHERVALRAKPSLEAEVLGVPWHLEVQGRV